MSYFERMREQNIRFIQSDCGEHVVLWLNKFNQHFVPQEVEPTILNNLPKISQPSKWYENGSFVILREGRKYDIYGRQIVK